MSSSDGFSIFSTQRRRTQTSARITANKPGRWPVVCLPGLTRNARDFHELALYLSQRADNPRKVIAFDYRGRGQSGYDPDIGHYNVGIEAGDVLAGLAALNVKEAAFIGTSRGGLIIHVLGALRPTLLKAIVLNDIGPVIEAEGLAHIRTYLDLSPKPKSRTEAINAQRSAHGGDFPALTEADWERMVSALYRETDRGLLPDFDPRLVETLSGLDPSKPLPDLWPQFYALAATNTCHTRRQFQILSVKNPGMGRRHSGMETITVDGQGHAPFLETGSLPGAILAFLHSAENTAQTK